MSRCGNDRRPGCGAEIDWGVTPEGKRVPLSRGAPIYRLGPFDHESGAYPIERIEGYRVSHFKTCPKASEFSRPATRPKNDARARAAGDN
jgi:hypothetical protein